MGKWFLAILHYREDPNWVFKYLMCNPNNTLRSAMSTLPGHVNSG